ncbi:MAG: maleylacetoacetate isomerase [Maricaulis sp.]|jgi:maleylacetoacetate isomerase|nr:maleylacetoacetate isomerase [Maricaulis sp.]HAQ34083.1 maleylacetoacetate isomerase [Alphaproteobacteria bacterium]
MSLTLYGYWRSSASYRLRIALNLKGVAFEQKPVDLRTGAQRDPDFRTFQPQGFVPALVDETGALIQSPAILEWIDETWPDPAFLPGNARERARLRAYAAVIGCDIHPIQNLSVLQYIKAELDADQTAVQAWARHWITNGLTALETMAAQDDRGGPFLWGKAPTMADIYLVPQMYNARRFGVDMEALPRLVAADDAARAHPAFEAAAPENQPDAPEDGH